jgi:hypothetical protein
MEPVSLKDLEQTDEVRAAVAALSHGKPVERWVHLFSANGKHGSSVRRDPQRPSAD